MNGEKGLFRPHTQTFLLGVNVCYLVEIQFNCQTHITLTYVKFNENEHKVSHL